MWVDNHEDTHVSLYSEIEFKILDKFKVVDRDGEKYDSKNQ